MEKWKTTISILTFKTQLLDCEFWWRGPAWLSKPGLSVFQFNHQSDHDLEEKVQKVTVNSAILVNDFMQRFSSLLRLKRVTALVLRVLRRIKLPVSCRISGPLLASELQNGLMVWIKVVQSQHFSEEIAALKKNNKVHVSSKLKNVILYLENQGMNIK